MTTTLMIIALVILILLSAFFSSSETAFLCIPKIRLRQMQKEKKPKAKLIVELKNKTEILLTVILVGNNFVNALSSSLATALAISLLGDKGTSIATLIMTVVIIMFGEILPKTIATYKSEEVAAMAAVPLNTLRKLLFPIVFVFAKFTMFVKHLFSRNSDDEKQITEGELRALFDLGDKEGTLETAEKNMLHKIFEFSDLRARDIECSRTLVEMIDVESSYTQALEIFSLSRFSRLPVYEKTTEDIIGLIHFKDILYYEGKEEDFSLKALAKKALFIPETKDALGILQTFKAEKQNFAIVISEHGSFSGILTMDDLVKAVFGRISEGYDQKIRPVEDRITIVNPTEFVIPGDIELEEINHIFKMNLTSIDSDTIAGWLLETFDYLPEEGESIKHSNIQYTVESQKNRRIQLIRMRVLV